VKNNDELVDMIFNSPRPEKKCKCPAGSYDKGNAHERYCPLAEETSAPGWFTMTNPTMTINYGNPITVHTTSTSTAPAYLYFHNANDIAQAMTTFTTATTHTANSLHAFNASYEHFTDDE
jgi:hypothetical protein